VLGIVISLGGIVLAMSVQAESLGALARALGKSGLPLLLALVGSLMWGLYSNLAKRYPQVVSSGAVGIFLFVTGISLFAVSFGAWQRITWSLRAAGELTYTVIFPASLAYCFWDIAMRDGNIALLGSASNLIPVLATLIASVYLQVALRWELLGGALGVVLGAFLCQLAFRRGYVPTS
jgi:drug/metabolite transporter (DMT)-like permease